MRRWTVLGASILVAGVILGAYAFPLIGHDVVRHQGRSATARFTGLDETELEAGSYTLWIEDIHPGFDDGQAFVVDVFSGWRDIPENHADVIYPERYVTRVFDGVRCELVAGVDDIEEGEWEIDILHLLFDEMERGDRMEVFLVRDDGPVTWSLVGSSLALICVGIIVLALDATYRPRGIYAWRGPDREPRARSPAPGPDDRH